MEVAILLIVTLSILSALLWFFLLKKPKKISDEIAAQSEALRISEARTRAIIEFAFDAFIGMDPSGNITDWNRQAEKTFGWKRDEVLGKQLSDIVIPDRYREAHKKGLARYLATGEGPVLNQRIEVSAYHRDGHEVPIELTIYPIRQGDSLLFGSFLHDISEKKQNLRIQQTQLKVTETLTKVFSIKEAIPLLLQKICEGMEWGAGELWLKDPTGAELRCIGSWAANPVTMNSFMERGREIHLYYGAGIAGTVWKTGEYVWIEDLLAEKDLRRRKEAEEAGFASLLAFPLKASEDQVLGVMMFFMVKKTPPNYRTLELISDIGNYVGLFVQRKQAEEKLTQIYQDLELKVQERTQDLAEAYDQAQTANRLKDEFLATVSHELRTPLGVILGHSDLLAEGGMSEDERSTSLETIRRNAKAQLQIISDLLDVSRIITGKMQLVLAPVDLATGVQSAIDSIRIAASTKNIDVIAEIEPDIGPIRGDVNRLQQILWNLLSNAVKFTPKNGHVKVKVDRYNSKARIEVIDSGKGIEASFLPYVFERFRQEDSSTTRKFGGLGLGLAIVRHLVEAHGGTIEVASEGLDKGSKFTVYLPLMAFWKERDPYYTKLQPRDLAIQEREGTLLQGVRILVIDDEPDTLTLMGLVLRRAGAIAFLASSMEEGLRKFQEVHPDIMISDISMPEHDGLELIAKIRHLPEEAGSQIPAIALTAHAREEEKSMVLAAGFDRHLAKPIEPSVLVEQVLAAVADSKQKPKQSSPDATL